ncbi:site-specific integrase [Prolixibacter sp. NT017]|uniref:site-specific integrase n=1 Tax=Prolixibacter sp. NT017 TaxID=2652390 RepID=UPI00127404C7|nr:site-specific integrase [Prolixibacter sp. NT017]GET25848.1 integrase [Prolixibacter sp. NT017]
MKKSYSIKLIGGEKSKLKDGSSPIGLVIRKQGKRKIMFLGISALPEQWNSDFQLYIVDSRKKNLHPDREQNNKWLAEVKKRSDKILEEFEENRIDWTLNQFEQRFLNKSKHTGVEGYFQDYIDKLDRSGKIGNKKAYENTLGILKLFDSKFSRLSFNDIDLKYINKFDEFLRVERGLTNATIKYYIKTFRALLNKAIKEGEASSVSYPFGKTGYSISALEQESEKRYLPNDYLEKLKTAELKSHTLRWVRNLFLFSYYCQGMSFADVAALTTDNILVFEGGHYIAYRRQKTEGKDSKIIRIKISDNIQQLLDWFKNNTQLVENYLTPCVSIAGYEGEKLYDHIRGRYRRYNKHLKTLGEELNFEGIRLSSYMSRHSYAMRLKNSGVPEDVISEALGHKDLATTKVYLDSFQKDEIAKANELL